MDPRSIYQPLYILCQNLSILSEIKARHKWFYVDPALEYICSKYHIVLVGSDYYYKLNTILNHLAYYGTEYEKQAVNQMVAHYQEFRSAIGNAGSTPIKNQYSQSSVRDTTPKILQQTSTPSASRLTNKDSLGNTLTTSQTMRNSSLDKTRQEPAKSNNSRIKTKPQITLSPKLKSARIAIGDLSCKLLNWRLDYYEWIQEFSKSGYGGIEWLNRSVAVGRSDTYLKARDSGSVGEIAAIVVDNVSFVVPTCYLNERNLGGIVITSWFKVRGSGNPFSEIEPAIAYVDGSSYEIYSQGTIQ